MATLKPPTAPLATSTSPKRKRDHLSLDSGSHTPRLQHQTSKFSFELPAQDCEDGSSSPRSKVARKFQGLALGVVATDSGAGTFASSSKPFDADSTSGAAKRSANDSLGSSEDMHYVSVKGQADDGSSIRKRLKLPDPTETSPRNNDAAQAGASLIHMSSVFTPILDKSPENQPNSPAGDSSATDPTRIVGAAGGKAPQSKAGSGISVFKGRDQRAGPPSVAAKTSGDGTATEDSDMDVVDPVRAALTWHEDEITVYDPNDEDDDGVGINGIGFRPTPAIAHARSMKRRQQLAEYKKREEREARARRNLRRRTSPKSSSEAAKVSDCDAKRSHSSEPPARRVRFTEFEPTVVITT
ncbi:hypothetical protein PpBr36_04314 [Pyricularia pennisetigena]|uniref:hypothetical protein n=1 Tax=Pyricularia pennisetigena TaxID=1578925 RepID=UPI0011545BED|nr:hypothetical protein PpBr36_04314 [Pyricularia pennisetigena]TLS27685.1 hypothetical protein PpBr36_04314 [Pyricularia pennisetigena]